MTHKRKLSKTEKAEPVWFILMIIGLVLVGYIAFHS